ncbi:MAG: hypothetical protein RLZ98_1259 [Pseudomonadota bacterium]|jgi:heme exporter protein A
MVERLRLQHLRVERGMRTVIAGLDATVEAGEALLLTGPNGAGKTTLLRTIASFIRPTDGTIALDGADPDRELGELAHLVAMADAVKSNLTVVENARFWSQFLGGSMDAGAKAIEYLGLLPLADVPAGYLSAGQRRRLGLSRLLVAERPLWLLDEPTVALDAHAVSLLTSMIEHHLGSGGIAVVATHMPLELSRSRELRLVPFAPGLPPEVI